MNESELRDLLNDLLDTHYPADVMSRLVVTRLAGRQIRHHPMLGRVEWQGKTLTPHFWVEVGDYIVDFCARRDLGATAALPQGIVPKAAIQEFYQGQEIVIDPLPDYLYELVYKGPATARAA